MAGLTDGVKVQDSNDLSQYKGEVRKCEYCKPEENLLGRACQWCLAQGYLAQCKNCKGSGKVTRGSVWDGGRSNYTETCNPCGGKGTYPARESEYIRQQHTRHLHLSNGDSGPEFKSPPKAVNPMQHLDMSNRHK